MNIKRVAEPPPLELDHRVVRYPDRDAAYDELPAFVLPSVDTGEPRPNRPDA